MFPLVSASVLFALCGLVFKDSKFSFPSHAMGGQQGVHHLQQGLVPSAGEKTQHRPGTWSQELRGLCPVGIPVTSRWKGEQKYPHVHHESTLAAGTAAPWPSSQG